MLAWLILLPSIEYTNYRLAVFLISVTSYLTRSSLREESLTLAHGLKRQSILVEQRLGMWTLWQGSVLTSIELGLVITLWPRS